MGRITLVNNNDFNTKENKEELFKLINSDEQFIIVNQEYTIDNYIDAYTSTTERRLEKTAVNKSHIVQVF